MENIEYVKFTVLENQIEILCQLLIWREIRYANNRPINGSVGAILKYIDISQTIHEWRKVEYEENLHFESASSSYKMKIYDFVLPICLRRKGLGTLIWSSIYNFLPEEIRSNLIISGLLSREDSSIKTATVNGDSIAIERIDNSKRRNQFWRRMIKTPPIKFPEENGGNGAFIGYMIDPCKDSSFVTDLFLQLAGEGVAAEEL